MDGASTIPRAQLGDAASNLGPVVEKVVDRGFRGELGGQRRILGVQKIEDRGRAPRVGILHELEGPGGRVRRLAA